MSGGQRRFPFLRYGLGFVLIWAFTLSPVVVLAIANAGANPPMQLTELMASMGLLGWLFIAPFPLGTIAFLIWFVALIIHLLAFGRKRTSRSE